MPNRDETTHAVRHNRFDREDLLQAAESTPGFRGARRRLNATTSTGTQAVDDLFYLLLKVDARLVDRTEMAPEYLVNYAVAEEMTVSRPLERLRELTWADPFQAAAACVDLVPQLEAVFDRLRLAQERADELAVALANLERALPLLSDAQAAVDELSGDLSPEELQEMADAIDRLRSVAETVATLEAMAQTKREQLDEALEDAAPEVGVALGGALGGLADDLEQGQTVAAAWGVSPGELRQMPAAERLALARTLNTDKMRRVAELFGRIRNLSLSTACDTVEVHEEIVDLELGDDLGRVVPAELLALAHPTTELDFLARWADGELTQYAVEGTEQLGRGAIIMAIDGTGSMGVGDRDRWAKAVMLVLLNQAKTQGRTMHVLVFGYHQMLHVPFVEPADFSPENLVKVAGAFWHSGTDFTTPMTKALELLGEEFAATGRTSADVVFATDDECFVPTAFMAHYLSEMHRMKARTWGVNVAGHANDHGALAQMSEGRVMTVEDLTSGDDIVALLVGTR